MKQQFITLAGWILSILTHAFPNTFYVTLELIDKKRVGLKGNIRSYEWHPEWLGTILEVIGVTTIAVHPSQL